MRIAIDCRKVADFGIGTYIRGLIHALSAREGNETWIFLAPEKHRSLLPETKSTQFVAADSPHYSVRELFAIGSAVRKLDVDLFHAPHYVVPFTTLPMVVTIHDLIHLHLPARRAMDRGYARWMIGRAVAQSRRVLTVTAAVGEDIAAHYPDARDKLVVTPNGIDSAFSPFGGQGDGAIMEKLRIEPTGYFLFVGNRKPHKNVARLLDAWTRMADSGLRLVLAGGDWSGADLPPNAIAAGFVSLEELAALYRNALGVIQPSLEEGFGLPVAEAMASGAPVIASRISSLMEVAGDACIPIDPHDPGTIADAMLAIAGDTALRERLRTLGIERAKTFTWERCADLTLAAYREAFSGAL